MERWCPIALLVLSLAAKKYGKGVGKQQGIILRLADLVMAAYVAESTLLRAEKDAVRRGEKGANLPIAAATIICEEAITRAESLARQCLVAVGERKTLGALATLVRRKPADIVAQRKVIASKLIAMERLLVVL